MSGTDRKGLSSEEVLAARKQFGFNELPAAKRKPLYRIALEVMQEPMFLLLLACSVLYLLLGDNREGLILISSIIFIIGITFFQHRRTERALEALRDLASPRALVIRDGREVRIAGREVVPGDILLLAEGDRVPADGMLLESGHLRIDESMLSGESVPVLKDLHDESWVYSGTLVVGGKGLAQVAHIGADTKFGSIGRSLGQLAESGTRLQQEMKVFIRNMFIAGLCISLLVFLGFLLTRDDWMPALLNALAAAMAILPEEFPVVFTVFLALGAWRMSRRQVLTRKPTSIESLGAASVLCTDKTGTITENRMQVAILQSISHKVTLHDAGKNPDTSRLKQHAAMSAIPDTLDPMEKALHDLDQQSISVKSVLQEFSFDQQWMSTARIYQLEDGSMLSVAKGAPEKIFDLCSLTEPAREKISSQVSDLAGEGYRVLAVAYSELDQTICDSIRDIAWEWSGLVALADPVRPEVPDAVRQCRKAGIRVIMITGDYPVTASSIAAQIGLPDPDRVLTGMAMNDLTDAELQQELKKANVLARIRPEQKLRIVQALQRAGEVVAMTGDGVNDAPALKAADIGVAMGEKGTDVAREAADLVILDDHFASIVTGIRMGRRIYDNLRKAMSFIIAIHIPIIGLVLLPAFLNWIPILLLPVHIVLMELITDPVCSIVFEMEQEEEGLMKRPPRTQQHRFISWKNLWGSVLQGGLVFCSIMFAWLMAHQQDLSVEAERAIAFSACVLGASALAISKLSESRHALMVLMERNLAAMIVLTSAVMMLPLILFIPGWDEVFHLEFPGLIPMWPAFAGPLAALLILELLKFYRNQKRAFRHRKNRR